MLRRALQKKTAPALLAPHAATPRFLSGTNNINHLCLVVGLLFACRRGLLGVRPSQKAAKPEALSLRHSQASGFAPNLPCRPR